jgi:hypothetical protein
VCFICNLRSISQAERRGSIPVSRFSIRWWAGFVSFAPAEVLLNAVTELVVAVAELYAAVMGTFGHFVILAAVVLLQDASGRAGESNAPRCPALPYFDWNACPFEGCTYRQWIAAQVVPVYDTWKEKRRQIVQLAAGERSSQ